MRTAVIGVGNMGSKYACLIQEGQIRGLELCALTRVRGVYREMLGKSIEAGVPVFESADALFDAVEKRDLPLDCVIIATPHYSHESIAVRAFGLGLNVLSDKPSGVYSRQARHMEEAAEKSGKNFAMVFNQRTLPVYRQIRDIVKSGKYGALKRVSWVVTDWYRPEKYYRSSAWHSTWEGEGGGVLLNQCPHNLDLLQWILGMPAKLQGFCREGRYHDIQVEDDVTLYMEWENGATGTFISSTGEAPGINRLEISLEEAMLVCDRGVLKIGELYPELGMKEEEYRKTSDDYFRKIQGTWSEASVPAADENPYKIILQSYADACLGNGSNIADGTEGRKSLLLSNAAYLSSWEGRMVEIPAPGSDMEKEFEKSFESWLEKKKNEGKE